MNKILTIQLIVRPDCKLIAVDQSDYDSLGVDINNHVMVEFLSYYKDTEPISRTISIKPLLYERGVFRKKFESDFYLEKDGTYLYYKMLIPTMKHFQNEDGTYNDVIAEQLFYDNNQLYWFGEDYTADKTYTKDEVINNSQSIDNLIDAYKIVHGGYSSQTFYTPVKKIFSLCQLHKCLVNYQRQTLFNNGRCSYQTCESNSQLKQKRDFLMAAVFTLDYLKDLDNIEEAQRILDNILSCGSICDNDLTNIKDCGCGNSL